MKFNPITSVIALALSGLITYGFHAFSGPQGSDAHLALTVCAMLFTAVTLLCSIGIEFGSGRTTSVIRAVSGTTFLLGLVVLMVLALLHVGIAGMVIIMGILSLLFVLVAYTVSRSGQ